MGDFSNRTATVGDDGVISVVPRREDVGRDVLSTVDNEKEEDDERTTERIHLQSLDNCHVPDDGGDSMIRRTTSKPNPTPHKRLCLAMCCGESNPNTAGTGGTSLPKAPEKKPACAGLGIVYALLSSVFFSILALLVKKIDGVHAVEISAIRCFFQMVFVLPALIYYETGFLGPRGQRFFLFLRGLLGSNAMILLYYAVQQMPLADATVIVFSNPVFTSLLAWMFLKEKCTVWDFLFTIFTLTGVILIARPPFLFGSRVSGIEGEYTNHIKGTIAACGAAFCAACTMVVLRKMGKNVHYYLSVWYYAVMGLIESIIAMLVIGEWTLPFCGRDRWFLMSIGVLGIIGQTFLTKALQLEKAGPVALMRTMDVVMAFMLQFLFLSQYPTWWSLGGALCIICSTSGVALRKWFNSAKKNRRNGRNCTQSNI
ncbi:solute carrier family 35 member G1 [Anguilla rostrata]|uniref:solute carrier family 35 member G1 n=1 Tax=Anguilla rostrata TaxID=7938 RepID=UPI0030D4B883